jgi:hypothetical protein
MAVFGGWSAYREAIAGSKRKPPERVISRGHMKTILKISALPVLLGVLASVAHADSVTLNSAGSTSGPYTNGALQYTGTSPLNGGSPLVAPSGPTVAGGPSSYDVAANGVWVNPIAGTSWVSNSPEAGPDGSVTDPNAFYYFSTTFTAVGGAAAYDGSINIMADDTAEVLLNGAIVVPFGVIGGDGHCSNNVPSCNGFDTVSLNGTTLLSGSNTLTVIDAQTGGGPAGVDFAADLTQTPEPSSLLLLGTGLLGVALVVFRKAKPSIAALNS